MEELKNRILAHYKLHSATSVRSFWHFLNLANDPYSDAIHEMLRKPPQDALRQDLLSVIEDMNKVYKRESHLVDVEQG